MLQWLIVRKTDNSRRECYNDLPYRNTFVICLYTCIPEGNQKTGTLQTNISSFSCAHVKLFFNVAIHFVPFCFPSFLLWTCVYCLYHIYIIIQLLLRCFCRPYVETSLNLWTFRAQFNVFILLRYTFFKGEFVFFLKTLSRQMEGYWKFYVQKKGKLKYFQAVFLWCICLCV